MLRHQKQARRRSATGYNSETWKTESTIEDSITYLLTTGDFPGKIELPLDENSWIETYELENGREVVLEPEKEGFQINMREYNDNWKKNDVDFTYFHHSSREINEKVDSYMENI